MHFSEISILQAQPKTHESLDARPTIGWAAQPRDFAHLGSHYASFMRKLIPLCLKYHSNTQPESRNAERRTVVNNCRHIARVALFAIESTSLFAPVENCDGQSRTTKLGVHGHTYHILLVQCTPSPLVLALAGGGAGSGYRRG